MALGTHFGLQRNTRVVFINLSSTIRFHLSPRLTFCLDNLLSIAVKANFTPNRLKLPCRTRELHYALILEPVGQFLLVSLLWFFKGTELIYEGCRTNGRSRSRDWGEVGHLGPDHRKMCNREPILTILVLLLLL